MPKLPTIDASIEVDISNRGYPEKWMPGVVFAICGQFYPHRNDYMRVNVTPDDDEPFVVDVDFESRAWRWPANPKADMDEEAIRSRNRAKCRVQGDF